jgi:predicted ester cyclase
MPVAKAQSPIRRILEEAFNEGNLAVIDELVTPDSVTRSADWGIPSGREGWKQLIATFRTAFPDLCCTIEDEIQMEGRYAAHWTIRGTLEGMLLGNRPTGRTVLVEGMVFAHVAKGRVAEYRILVDRFGMLQQLGLVLPPASLAKR